MPPDPPCEASSISASATRTSARDFKSAASSECLLLLGTVGAHDAERVDQELARCALDHRPVGLELAALEIVLERGEQLVAVDLLLAEPVVQVRRKAVVADAHDAIGRRRLGLVDDLETRNAGDADGEATVVELLVGRHAARRTPRGAGPGILPSGLLAAASPPWG